MNIYLFILHETNITRKGLIILPSFCINHYRFIIVDNAPWPQRDPTSKATVANLSVWLAASYWGSITPVAVMSITLTTSQGVNRMTLCKSNPLVLTKYIPFCMDKFGSEKNGLLCNKNNKTKTMDLPGGIRAILYSNRCTSIAHRKFLYINRTDSRGDNSLKLIMANETRPQWLSHTALLPSKQDWWLTSTFRH